MNISNTTVGRVLTCVTRKRTTTMTKKLENRLPGKNGDEVYIYALGTQHTHTPLL